MKISVDEAVFLGGLAHRPQLIFAFSDLPLNKMGEFAGRVYGEMIRIMPATPEDVISLFIDMLKTKKITSEEYHYCATDKFNLTVITYEMTVSAYKSIVALFKKMEAITLLGKIKGIDDDDAIDLINQAHAVINHDDCLPRSYKIAEIQIENHERAFSFGIDKLDQHIRPGKNCLTFLGARAFSGKTSFACNIAMENCRRGIVVFLSLEMSKEQIKEKLSRYGDFYKPENLRIYELSKISLQSIEKIILIDSPVLVIIDQFNKISGVGKEYEIFTHNARMLKEIVNRTRTPIIALAQLNRSADGDEAPSSSKFKGSGSIEEEGDLVLLLSVKNRDEFITSIHVAKNRTTLRGRIGVFDVKYNPETNFFSNF